MIGLQTRRIIAFSTLLSCASPLIALAQTPSQSAICQSGFVNKEKLATFLLDAAPVSRRAEDWATAHPSPDFSISPRQRMLADVEFCDNKLSPEPGAASVCTGADEDNLAKGRFAIFTLLHSPTAYENTAAVEDAVIFLMQPDAQLLCRTDDDGSAIHIPGDQPTPTFTYLPIRVRGNTDSLYIDRDDPAFAIAAASAITISDDQTTDKRTDKVTLVVGWPIALQQGWQVVPYVGINRDLSRPDGQPSSVTADTWQVGAAFSGAFHPGSSGGPAASHWFTVRPDYMGNDDDGSRLWTLNATWTPVVNGHLNDWRQLGGLTGNRMSWRPMFDLRTVVGVFSRQGDRTDEQSQDFWRIGTQIGAAFKSDDPRWPLTFVVTETYLPAIEGGSDIDYFQSRLSWALDPKSIFLINVVYGDGRRTDLDPEEQGWKISLGVKY